jgi:hypothetical protein
MRLEIIILLITAFFIFNTYHDGKYTKMLLSYKKYMNMGVLALVGISLYLLMKRNPAQCRNILLYANNMIKYAPIDRSSMEMISPIIDFTSGNRSFMSSLNQGFGNSGEENDGSTGEFPLFGANAYEQKILTSGGAAAGGTGGAGMGFVRATKRSVSETKKKYVASMQNWKCKKCNQQLNAWFEVDHIKRLEYGGTNEVQNLVALCRECHGQKTAMENM